MKAFWRFGSAIAALTTKRRIDVSDEKPNNPEDHSGPPAPVDGGRTGHIVDDKGSFRVAEFADGPEDLDQIDDGARSRWPLSEGASQGERARLGESMAGAFWQDLREVFGNDANRLRMVVGRLKEFQLELHLEQSRYVPPLRPDGEVDVDAQELQRVIAMADSRGDG